MTNLISNRIILVGKTSTRIELERDVSAHNSPLACVVKRMSTVHLLRNCHPLYRTNFVKRLFDEGQITKQEKELFKTINTDNYYDN